MERRMFLGGLTAASFGALLENAFAEPAAQTLWKDADPDIPILKAAKTEYA